MSGRGVALNDVRWSYKQQVIAARSNERGYERERDDFYPTPPEATQAMLKAETFSGPVWEPACGDGAISKVLEAAGYPVVSSDLLDRGYGETGIDFLLEWQSRAPNVCTNPPFKLAVPFVRNALTLTTGKVVMLLKLAFLEGQDRSDLFAECPPARVWIFSRRLAFTKGSAHAATNGGGMLAFAWFVWERGYQGRPQLGWLPDRHYCPTTNGSLGHAAAIAAMRARFLAAQALDPTLDAASWYAGQGGGGR